MSPVASDAHHVGRTRCGWPGSRHGDIVVARCRLAAARAAGGAWVEVCGAQRSRRRPACRWWRGGDSKEREREQGREKWLVFWVLDPTNGIDCTNVKY